MHQIQHKSIKINSFILSFQLKLTKYYKTMSQQSQNQLPEITKIELLHSQWTLWLSYSSDNQNDINYGNNLMQIQKIKSWNQFAELWQWVAKTEDFFISPHDGAYKKYKFGIQNRKIDSINFFKNDTQPQWEFGDNHKYGYFNFGIDRLDERVNSIFQASVFLTIGASQQISKKIFGVRIVDVGAKLNHPSRSRIQIWVDFRHDNSMQSLKNLLDFQSKLEKYYKQTINYEIGQIKFFNISNVQTPQVKTPKKDYTKRSNNTQKTQNYPKNQNGGNKKYKSKN